MAAVELVIYTVKPVSLNNFRPDRDKIYRMLSEWDGFLSGVTFQSIGATNTFTDYLLLGSLEQAYEAAERIRSELEAQDCLGCMDEIMAYQYFEAEDDQPRFTRTDEDDVFEVASSVVDTRKRVAFRSIKSEVISLMRRENGFKDIAAAETGEGMFNLDILQWQSMDAAQAAMKSIHKTEQCGVFMETFKSHVHFDHMRLLA